MKLPVVILSASLTANAALLSAFALRPTLAPPSIRDYFTRSEKPAAAGPAAPLKVATPQKNAAVPSPLWPSLHTPELSSLVARLRAAGFPPWIVRALVDAEIEARFAPRIKALTKINEETPYWKPDPSYFTGSSKMFEELNQIYRERSRALRELLGQDALAWGGSDPSTAQRRQFGQLSPAKIDLVQRINDDYNEMTGQVRAAMQGVTLPEDRQKLALLEKEKRADLVAVLTPGELTEYELRSSMTAMRMRTPLTMMDASEAEFRTIFNIQHPFSDALNPMSGFMTQEMSEQRREVTKQMNEKIKVALGDARYADYQRANDREYQQLYRIGQQANVPMETIVRAHDLRESTVAASMKIFDDGNLSADDKRLALKNLAQSTRNQLLSTLGPTAGPAAADNSRWLTYLQQGSAITMTPDGYVMPRQLPLQRPAATAPKK